MQSEEFVCSMEPDCHIDLADNPIIKMDCNRNACKKCLVKLLLNSENKEYLNVHCKCGEPHEVNFKKEIGLTEFTLRYAQSKHLLNTKTVDGPHLYCEKDNKPISFYCS